MLTLLRISFSGWKATKETSRNYVIFVSESVTKVFEKNRVKSQKFLSTALFKIVSREVHVPKSCPERIFEPFLKSCPSEVRVP